MAVSALVAENRPARPVRAHQQVTGDLAPTWFCEAGELLSGQIVPLDVGFPERADCAEGDLASGDLAEEQPAGQRARVPGQHQRLWRDDGPAQQNRPGEPGTLRAVISRLTSGDLVVRKSKFFAASKTSWVSASTTRCSVTTTS